MTDALSSHPTKVGMKPIRCVLLEKDNYFPWEAQFSTMLCGLNLIQYVEGAADLSSPTAHQQDQLILSWILTGIAPSILPQVASFRTAAGVWSCLKRLFVSSTQHKAIASQVLASNHKEREFVYGRLYYQNLGH